VGLRNIRAALIPSEVNNMGLPLVGYPITSQLKAARKRVNYFKGKT
jgi:hypothetical protein